MDKEYNTDVGAQPSNPTAFNNTSPVEPVPNSQEAVPIQSTPSPPEPAPQPAIAPSMPPPPKKHSGKAKLVVLSGVIILGVAVVGAFLLGKHNERVVFQSPPPKPISLPPQTIVYAAHECVPGRGKQYIIPKDLPSDPSSIPFGPIYDVYKSKVIAVEYNFTALDLTTKADKLSNTIIPFFKNNYQVSHFTITPGAPPPGVSETNTPINVAIFVVSKAEANTIKCNGSSG